MNNNEVLKKLEARKAKLKEILYNYSLVTGEKTEIRISQIKNYISELKDLMASVECIEKEIFIVAASTLEAKSKKADFVSIEEEGYYFKLCLLQSFPYNDIYMIYLTPLSCL